jgi:tRNA threonylcarbamoyladenosine biosynthesis protein TsaE
MEALGQPGQQSGLCGRQIHTGHANLGESKLVRACTDVCEQCVIEWSAVDHQLPIVETGLESPPTKSSLRLLWNDETATQAFAAQLAVQAGLGKAFITLHGDLGAGKTTFTRHLLHALGVAGRIKSPTYTIVESYDTATFAAWHFDFYRFNDPQEWEDAGFRDIFASPGLKLAEWPQKAEGLLPAADLDIALLTEGESARRVTLTAHTSLGLALLQGLAPSERAA